MALNLIRLRDIYNISIERMLDGNIGIGKSARYLTQEECWFIRQVCNGKLTSRPAVILAFSDFTGHNNWLLTCIFSDAAYSNLLKEEFTIWHQACRNLAPESANSSTIKAEFNRKLKLLDSLTSMISSARNKGGKNIEDLLSEKLSSEAVSRLVIKPVLLITALLHTQPKRDVFILLESWSLKSDGGSGFRKNDLTISRSQKMALTSCSKSTGACASSTGSRKSCSRFRNTGACWTTTHRSMPSSRLKLKFWTLTLLCFSFTISWVMVSYFMGSIKNIQHEAMG